MGNNVNTASDDYSGTKVSGSGTGNTTLKGNKGKQGQLRTSGYTPSMPNKGGDGKGVFDRHPNPTFGPYGRDHSGMIPTKFSEEGILTGSKRQTNKMSRGGAIVTGQAKNAGTASVKRGPNRYNQAGSTVGKTKKIG